MNGRFCIALILVSVFYVSGVFGYDVNKELRNDSPYAAFDLTVVLEGVETVTDTYDGNSAPGSTHGTFKNHQVDYTTGGAKNTRITWSGFWDGTDTKIDKGQTIHVGWSTKDQSSNVIDMYWTDSSGRRIDKSAVYNITTGYTFLYGPANRIIWDNIFDPNSLYGQRQTITISNVHYAVLMNLLPLADLNAGNAWLTAQFQPFPEGTTFNVPFGESVTLPIPGTVGVGSAIVLRYEVSAPGSAAQSLDFVQFLFEAPNIPTVSQWGLIVMAGLLVTVGAIVIVRHRQRVAA